MVTKVIVPMLGWTMKEGLIVRWLKREGDSVEKGEPLFELETEKAVNVIEAPASGILRKILIPEGYLVPVSETVAIIAEANEEIPEFEKLIERAKEIMGGAKKPVGEKLEKVAIEEAEQLQARIKISPAARKLAEEYGIDITKVVGTGPEGRITRKDVLMAVEKRKLMPKIKQVIPMTAMRKTIAERLAHSYRTAVHASVGMEVDMSEILKLREKLAPEIEKMANVHLSLTDIFVKVVATALKEYLLLNAAMEDDKIKIFEDINIGVATAIEGGLVVPVIRNADKKSLAEIAIERKELTQRAKDGKLSIDDMTGGTFTISNMGMFGVTSGMSIINPPEVAILSIGAIVEKPVVYEGKIAIKPMMGIGLSFDHRVIDGATAAMFLQRIKKELEHPSMELYSTLTSTN
jgi:pyruvate dehydrogenase E2 component (dihydrolipoamide acetyltransferase)